MESTENHARNYQHAWHEIRATLVEMVDTLGAEPFCLERKAQLCLDGVRWPHGVRCPYARCGSANVQAVGGHEPMPYLCPECQRPFSATSATILSSINIDGLELLAATYVTVAYRGLVRARALAEWLEADEQTAKLLLELIEHGVTVQSSKLMASQSAGVSPADCEGDAVAMTFRVLAYLLRAERDASEGVIADAGVEAYWRRVLPQLDPVRQSRCEPTLPGIGPRIVPRPSATARKRKARRPRKSPVQEPKTRPMRPDQPEIRGLPGARELRHEGAA